MQVKRERVRYSRNSQLKWRSKEREAGGRLLKCENTWQETWNL